MKTLLELEAVLSAEQDLLLSGDFDRLQSLFDRKLRLAEQLSREKPELSEDRYQSLKQQSARNEALLKAAQRGLKAAITQVSQASEAPEQTTYSRSGQRQSMSRAPRSVTQKL